MLDTLRKGTGTWVAKIFIALLVFSFAIWGVADVFTGFGQNVAAKVGETEISTFTYDRAYRQDLNRIGQQIGRPLSTTDGVQFGIPQQTLGRLVAEAAMNESARQLSLGVSDTRLAGLIQADPAFQRPGGGYDRALLAQILRSNGLTEDEYVVERRDLAVRQQLAEGVAGGMDTPLAYLEALHAFENEIRDVRYLRLEPSFVGDIEDPAEADLSAFFKGTRSDFRAPEYREIMLLELTPETLARPNDITEEMARDEYDRDSSRYYQPERRRIRQMVFQVPAEAAEAATRLSAGATFEDLMAERNLSANDVDLGIMARGDFLDDAVGDAAFALGEGETSGAVEGRFSTVILNAVEVLPETTQPFDEVKDEIKALLAAEEAEREVLDLVDEIEDARAGGALLAEVASRFQLTTSTPAAFDRQGHDAEETQVALPDADGLISGVFDSDVGVENDPLQLGRQGFLWYEVTNVIPERDRELDEVRPRVTAAWKNQQMRTRLQERAQALADRLRSGETFEAIEADTGLETATAEAVSRVRTAADFSRAAIDAVFSGPIGTVAAVEGANGPAELVLKVENSSVPAFFAEAQDVRAIRAQLSQQLQDSLLGQFVSDIEAREGVEVNDAAISYVIGLTERNGR